MTRITNGMMTSTLMRNLYTNMNKMNKTDNQMSSQTNISRPSDDPAGLAQVLRITTSQAEIKKYSDNVENATTWLGMSDTALGQAGDLLHRVKELAVQGANGTNTSEERNSDADEVEQILNQMVEIGNSNYEGKYIFGGFRTDAPPFKIDAASNDVTYNGDAGAISAEVGKGVTMKYNILGTDAFGDKTNGMMATLKNLAADLRSGNSTGIEASLGTVDTDLNNLLTYRSQLGAKTNRMEFMQQRLEDNGNSLESLQSSIQDVDIAKLSVEMTTQQNVYKAALSVGAKIIQPSLMDFLR